MQQITADPIGSHMCAIWCSDHANGTPANRAPELDDQLCRHAVTSPAFGEILVTACAAEGAVIHLYNTRDELTPAEAEAFAYTLLAQVAATRTAVAA